MRLIIVTFCSALLLAVLLVAGCNSERIADKSTPSESDSLLIPDAEVYGATIQLYDKGRVTTKILADKIVKFDSIDSTMGYDLDIDFYDSTGAVSSHVVGDSGVIRENAGLLHIFGNVVVVTNDNRKLNTDDLLWNKATNKITTDAFVRITRGKDVVTGWGLVANNDLSQVTIKKASGEMSDTTLTR